MAYEVPTTTKDMEEYEEGERLSDDSETLEIRQDPASSWRLNTGQMYAHTSSAINEALSNSVTAVRRARDEGVWDANIYVTITEKSENEVYLEIRDEGIGMTMQVIRENLTRIGAKGSYTGEEYNTKFGRGFYATVMLVGEEKNDGKGAFLLSTNPRAEDTSEKNPPHNYIWKPTPERVENPGWGLNDEEYGTKLIFPVRDDISADDLESWVRDFAEYARIPVRLEREYPDGSTEDDELGGDKLEDKYDDNAPYFVDERDGLYRAVVSPDANGNLVILDALTDTKDDLEMSWPEFDIDIRLYNEDGPIVKCTDNPSLVGKIPVSETVYNKEIPDSKKDKYVVKSNIAVPYTTMDEPSGSRDVISLSDEFKQIVIDRLEEKLHTNLEEIFDIVDKPEDVKKLSERQYQYLRTLCSQRRLRTKIKKTVGDKEYSIAKKLGKRLRIVNRGVDVENKYNVSRSKYTYEKVIDIINQDCDFYYGRSILDRRAKAVWNHDDEALVVQAKEVKYEVLDDLDIGESIYNITSSRISEMDVSDDIAKKFNRSTSGGNSKSSSNQGLTQKQKNDYNYRTLKIHSPSYLGTSEQRVGDIREMFGEDLEDDEFDTPKYFDIQYLVLFTSTSDHKISENTDIISSDIGAATCVESVYQDVFDDVDNVVKYEEFVNPSTTPVNDISVLTTEGEMKFGEVKEYQDVSYIGVPDKVEEYLQEYNSPDISLIENFVNEIPDRFRTEHFVDTERFSVVLSDSVCEKLGKVYDINFAIYIKGLSRYGKYAMKESKFIDKLVNARLPRYDDKLTENIMDKDVFDALVEIHDNGGELSNDQIDVQTHEFDTITIETQNGTKTLDEIKSDGNGLDVVYYPDTLREKFGELTPNVAATLVDTYNRSVCVVSDPEKYREILVRYIETRGVVPSGTFGEMTRLNSSGRDSISSTSIRPVEIYAHIQHNNSNSDFDKNKVNPRNLPDIDNGGYSIVSMLS